MRNFILSFGGLTLSMSVVIFILLVLSRIFKNRFTATCRYVIWLVVTIRLVLPIGGIAFPSFINIDVPIAEDEYSEILQSDKLTDIIPDDQQGIDVPAFDDSKETVEEELPSIIGGVADNDDTVVAPSDDVGKTENESPSFQNPSADVVVNDEKRLSANDYIKIIFAVWAVGATVFFGVNLVRYLTFSAKLNYTLTLPDDRLTEVYREACRRLNLDGNPLLYVSDIVGSPVHYGFITKKIVVPADVSEESLVNVLSHELTHYKRGDLWVKLIALAANSINWFNPFVYYAVRELNDEMELSCDELVLRGLNEEERISYSRVLLETAGRCKKGHVGLTTRFDSKDSKVKKRIVNILDMTKKKKGTVIITAVLIVCVVAGVLIGFSADKKEETPKENEPIQPSFDETVKESEFEESPETEPDINTRYKTCYGFDGGKLYGERNGDHFLMVVGDEEYHIPINWKKTLNAGEHPYLYDWDYDNDGELEYMLILPEGKKEEKRSRLYYIEIAENGSYDMQEIKSALLIREMLDRFNTYDYDSIARMLTLKYNGNQSPETLSLDNLLRGLGVSFNGVQFENNLYLKKDSQKGVVACLDGLGILNEKPSGSFKLTLRGVINYTDNGECGLGNMSLDTQITHFPSLRDYDTVYNSSRTPSYYLYPRDDLVFLQDLDDGVKLYGKYGGNEIALQDSGGKYFKYSITWINSYGLNYDKIQTIDIDKDGDNEYYLKLKPEKNQFGNSVSDSYLFDETDNGWICHPFSGKPLLEKVEKLFTYEYDSAEKMMTVYNDGEKAEEIRFGSKFEKSEDFGGLEVYSGGNATLTEDGELSYNVSYYVMNASTGYRTDVEFDVSADLEYSSENGLVVKKLSKLEGTVNGYDMKLYNSPLYSNNSDWSLRTDENWWLHIEGKNGKHFYYVNLRHLHYSTWVGEMYEPKENEEIILWSIYLDDAPEMYVFEDESRAMIKYRFVNTNEGFKYVDRAAIIDLKTGEIILNGGMTELMLFDAHRIPENIRKAYYFMSQEGPPQYTIHFEISQPKNEVIRFTNELVSYDKKIVLSGYVDYNISTNTATEYIITQNTVK